MAKKTLKHNLPGSIYKNKTRWWWKVKLPGETKAKAIALKPHGSNMATKDFSVAIECAKMLLSQHILKSQTSNSKEVRTVGQLVKIYLEHVDKYYRDISGKQTREVLNIRYSVKTLISIHSSTELESFGPLKLLDVREEMIAERIVRKTINQRIGRIKRMFKWAVTRQYVSPVIYQAIDAIEGLRRGRTTAKEGQKVKPVDESHVYAVLPYTTPVIATMIEMQLLTGMRPGELVQMKPADIDRSTNPWHYYPEKHKNEYRGHDRIVPLGPKCQELITPFLLRDPQKCCFSPAESEKLRRTLFLPSQNP